MKHRNRKWAFVALVVTMCLAAGIAYAADTPAPPKAMWSQQAVPANAAPLATTETAPQYPTPPVAPPPPTTAPAPPALPAGPPLAPSDLLIKNLPLSQLIEQAQKSSPEVLIAEAQLREAEAKLQQARLQAAERATQAYFDRAALDKVRESTTRMQDMVKTGTAPQQDLLDAEARLSQAEANVAKQNVYLSMLAKQAPVGPTLSVSSPSPLPHGKPAVRPEISVEFADRLKQSTSDIIQGGLTIEEVAVFLNEQFSLNTVVDIGVASLKIQINLVDPNVTLAGILSAIADSANVCFVIRDYGVYITSREQAASIVAPTIPEDVPLYAPPSDELFVR